MTIRRFHEFRWDDVEQLAYKEEGDHFRAITRQILFGEELGLHAQLRYFEIGPGGHSTLERHQHAHGVMVLRGRGEVLLGNRVEPIDERDLVAIPPMTWHQFRATRGEPLGFLCLVNCERDRPQLPTAAELEALRRDPAVAAFIRA
ncbi:MAG: 1-methylthio-xylulose 5-phosphate sulfo-lyase [Gammaproteobacteria bacterium]